MAEPMPPIARTRSPFQSARFFGAGLLRPMNSYCGSRVDMKAKPFHFASSCLT
jgi:hypothetical protein